MSILRDQSGLGDSLSEPRRGDSARRPRKAARAGGRPGKRGGSRPPTGTRESGEARESDESSTFHAYGAYDGYRVYRGYDPSTLLDVVESERAVYARHFQEWVAPGYLLDLFGYGAEVVPQLFGDTVVKDGLRIVAVLRPMPDGTMSAVFFDGGPEIRVIDPEDVMPGRPPQPIKYRTKAEVEAHREN